MISCLKGASLSAFTWFTPKADGGRRGGDKGWVAVQIWMHRRRTVMPYIPGRRSRRGAGGHGAVGT
ncbi:MAG: hypothetical protein M0Z65_12835 [Firmicutes bacterium]|nr:hypothetical protein [Bacillota bacterium]